jgi:Protein kinase domain
MGLKEGTLESLIKKGSGPAVAESVFYHILQALDCLAFNGIVHRDVKPENILYIPKLGGQYQFQLGDFGLCNRTVSAATCGIGSPLYMAPEMFRIGEQTHKVDVWSLYVTMLWTLDIRGFRQAQFKTTVDVQEVVLTTASNAETVSQIREMAIVNPEDRASAAQMLLKCFNGAGLSTPRHQVPALINSSAIVAAEDPASEIPAIATRNTQRVLQRKANISAAAPARYRVQKAHCAQPPRQGNQMTEKRPRQTLVPTVADKYQVPDAIPSNDVTAKRRKRRQEVYFT